LKKTHKDCIEQFFQNYLIQKILNRSKRNSLSIIHAASCCSILSIAVITFPSSCRRRNSLPLLCYFSFLHPLVRSKKKTSAKLRKCKLVQWHLSLQRPFSSGIKLCEEVVITESSRWHSKCRASPKHLVFMFVTISVGKYL